MRSLHTLASSLFIVISATVEFRFKRTFDEQTGYQELEIDDTTNSNIKKPI